MGVPDRGGLTTDGHGFLKRLKDKVSGKIQDARCVANHKDYKGHRSEFWDRMNRIYRMGCCHGGMRSAELKRFRMQDCGMAGAFDPEL